MSKNNNSDLTPIAVYFGHLSRLLSWLHYYVNRKSTQLVWIYLETAIR